MQCAVQHLLLERGTLLGFTIIYIVVKNTPTFLDENVVQH